MVRGGATVATVETRLFGRADKVWGRLSVYLQEAKNSVLDGPHGHVNCASGSCGHGYDTTTHFGLNGGNPWKVKVTSPLSASRLCYRAL